MDNSNTPKPKYTHYFKRRIEPTEATCYQCGEKMKVASGNIHELYIGRLPAGVRTMPSQIRYWHKSCRTAGRAKLRRELKAQRKLQRQEENFTVAI